MAKAFLCLNDWSGRSETEVEVIGETPKRYCIKALVRMKLAGRNRWLPAGETTYVPKRAIKFEEK